MPAGCGTCGEDHRVLGGQERRSEDGPEILILIYQTEGQLAASVSEPSSTLRDANFVGIKSDSKLLQGAEDPKANCHDNRQLIPSQITGFCRRPAMVKTLPTLEVTAVTKTSIDI